MLGVPRIFCTSLAGELRHLSPYYLPLHTPGVLLPTIACARTQPAGAIACIVRSANLRATVACRCCSTSLKASPAFSDSCKAACAAAALHKQWISTADTASVHMVSI